MFFIALQCTLWLGEGSIRGILALNQRIALQQGKNHQLLVENLLLERQIRALKQEPTQASSLVEDYIRWKLELVREGEWFCRW
jgi:cell division protein FtsB